MRYFDLAAPLRHEDEERHVLPRLREQGHAALADRVLDEHVAMARAWADVRTLLLDVAQDRWSADPDVTVREWSEFAALYREHIVLEEREEFPLARARIDAPGLPAMADEMAGRRVVRRATATR
jgi:hemerythrin-like domain-containing protein